VLAVTDMPEMRSALGSALLGTQSETCMEVYGNYIGTTGRVGGSSVTEYSLVGKNYAIAQAEASFSISLRRHKPQTLFRALICIEQERRILQTILAFSALLTRIKSSKTVLPPISAPTENNRKSPQPVSSDHREACASVFRL
jgi:hypothetical protein